jgi:3-keto-5-aminohexanoate cleavage enzyme
MKGSVLKNKLIITVAPLGDFISKEENPAIPYSPGEIADSVVKAWNEGASIAHIHCRNQNGTPTSDPMVFREINERIRALKCDIIIDHCTTGATIDDGMRSLEANPEMGTLTAGISVIFAKGNIKIMPRDQYWIEEKASLMLSKGIKPNIEVFNLPMIESVYKLIGKGLLKKPYWISLIMGTHRWNQSGTRYSLKGLLYHIETMPPDSMFSVVVQGDEQLSAATLSILYGGHCRAGFEDTLYYRKGQLAESNAQLVARIVRISRELGREPAAPDEVRQMLDIPRLENL